MKIGFLGNTNNYPFIIAKQMREMGCEIVFYVDAPPQDILHRPECLSEEISYPYPDWIIEKTSLRNSLHIHYPWIFERKLIKELNTCDAVILNDFGHRFKNYLRPGIPSISVFSGVDLDVMADYESVRRMKKENKSLRFLPGFLKDIYANFSVSQLRKGISQASLVSYFPEGTVVHGDNILKEIFHHKPFPRYHHSHVIVEGLSYQEPPQNEVIRIFSATRFMWKKPFPSGTTDFENKGNDIMIRGIALFLKSMPVPLDIHLVEKGLHVKESKELIEELGFSHMVTWHKQMPFKELQYHIKHADIVFDQLGSHYVSGGLYSMLQGRPVIGNARPDVFDKLLGEPTLLCHAQTMEEVKEWLIKLVNDPALREDIGKKSREYVLRHFNMRDESAYFKNFLEQEIARRKGKIKLNVTPAIN